MKQSAIGIQFASELNGGANRDRTDDLKLAKLALSQLSYGPSFARLFGELRRASPAVPLLEGGLPAIAA